MLCQIFDKDFPLFTYFPGNWIVWGDLHNNDGYDNGYELSVAA